MIRLKSNGILLNKTNLERLKLYPPAGIDISLYGCDSNSYTSLTGKDVFDLTVVVNTILFEANENTGRTKKSYDLTVAEYKCDPHICEFWETLYLNRNNL